MSSIVEFLGGLRAKNVALSLHGDTLKCSAPPGVLTAEMTEELRRRKPEVLAFLRVSQLAKQNGAPALAPIERIDRSGPLPLSLAQERLWFLTQLDPGSRVYNVGMPMRMRGPLNVSALERSLQEIVRRHEDLRTNFVQTDGEPRATIRDGRDWAFKIVDARHLADDGADSPLYECTARQYREPFDIERGPLFRASLLIAGTDDHILVLSMHHIVYDGWSLGILMRELAELYEAYASGRSPSLPPFGIQYVDFAAWQRTWLASGEMDRQLAYWERQLAGAPPVVEFPVDRRRPEIETFRGRRSKLVVPQRLAAALDAVAQGHGVTLFMVLLAAFKVLLARYSGQEDIVVGSPSAGRSREELHPLIGFFLNNLVLRTDLGGNPTFAELLGRIRDVTLQAYAHQEVPFDRLVQALRPERSLEHSPLFQTMFILQNFPLDELRLHGLEITPLELKVDTARFDLSVEVFLRGGELWVYFDCKSDLYAPETMERIQQHYLAVLDAVCADPMRRIRQIPLLSAAERNRLLLDWNRTDAEIPASCFHDRIAENALATPDRTAVVAGDESISYRELERRADRIAGALRARGAGPEKLVALCLERSVDLIAGMLGVAKSGAAYIPLDPAHPRQRIANILEDAQPMLLLTGTGLLPSLPIENVQVLCVDAVDELERLAAAESTSGPRSDRHPRPENLAYVIFTSGSTGRPKGVEIAHRALVNFLESMGRDPGFSSDDRLLAVTTVSFDIAALELLLPLYVGGTVCIAQQPADSERLLAELASFRPTAMQATPATWKLLLAAGWEGDPRLKILCGGEALESDLARSLLVRSGGLWNMYGPTETTIWSAALRVEGTEATTVPIGRPIQNTSFYVLDAFQQPVPLGVAGELWIGGEGLARGYLNRPELTNERFVTLQISGDSPTRLYRTGDLVRYRRNGTLDFLGRLDHQVKLRGYRIELEEIESALRNCAGIADAAVLLREDRGDKRLVAYIAASGAPAPSAGDIRGHLRTALPEYMLPAAFVFLDELPRLPNGKLNRAALPASDSFAVQDEHTFVAPATALQQSVSDLFCEVLNVERIGIDDNFFDLGAHSLQIAKIRGKLNRSLAIDIPLVSFFQHPTVRALAGSVEQCSSSEALTPLVPRDIGERIPQTQAQQGMWLIDHFGPGNPAYNMPFACVATSAIDKDALQQAVDGMVARHETLRTSFYEQDGDLFQAVAPTGQARLGFTDLSIMSEKDASTEMERLIREQARKPFDLSRAPLVRFHLIRLAAQRHVIFFNIHHIIADARSLSVLGRELSELYAAALAGRAPILPDLPIQFGDYAVWAAKQMNGAAIENQLRYWQSKLAGAPPYLELPFSLPHPEESTGRGAIVPVAVPAAVQNALKAIGRQEGATPFMVLLTCFAILLFKRSGEKDFCIGSPVTHRRHVETESLIGLFVNMVVFRCDLDRDPSFRELLRRMRTTSLEAYANSDLPFQELVRALKLDPRLRRSPLFQMMFSLEPYEQSEQDSMVSMDAHPGTSRFDLTLQLRENADGVAGAFEFSTDIFQQAGIEELARQFDAVLRQIIADPDRSISAIELPLPPEIERPGRGRSEIGKQSFWSAPVRKLSSRFGRGVEAK